VWICPLHAARTAVAIDFRQTQTQNMIRNVGASLPMLRYRFRRNHDTGTQAALSRFGQRGLVSLTPIALHSMPETATPIGRTNTESISACRVKPKSLGHHDLRVLHETLIYEDVYRKRRRADILDRSQSYRRASLRRRGRTSTTEALDTARHRRRLRGSSG
jgi:hypothetical protein